MSEENEVTGTTRIAAFLLSLDREHALEVLRHLDGELVSEVASAMMEVGDSFGDSEAVDALYSMIARDVNSPPKVVSQSDSQLKVLLAEAFDNDRAEGVLEGIRQRQLLERPFHEIEAYSSRLLASALGDETPASIAIILSHVDPSFSADIISDLDPELALETVTNMATMVSPDGSVLRSMASNLVERLVLLADQPIAPDPSVRLKTVAEMLNFSSSDLERSVLEGIESEDQEMAEEIREYMFTWTDLADVDKRSMQKILGSVDTRTLAIALKACAADVEENIASNLSTRVKAMVIEERELVGAVPMSEVLSSRGEVLKAVHALIDSGEFQPSRSGEELVS
jgi:flagellar motor switch protein FliG